MKTNANLLMSAVFLAAAMNSRGQPLITQEPTNQIKYVNTTTSFSVVATGAPPVTYQWRFNAADLPGKTDVSLVLSNAQFTNAGPYSVVVTDTGGSTTSQVAWLSVLPTNVVRGVEGDLRFGQP